MLNRIINYHYDVCYINISVTTNLRNFQLLFSCLINFLELLTSFIAFCYAIALIPFLSTMESSLRVAPLGRLFPCSQFFTALSDTFR